MKILILGGDGFCGWPTALHLSARGHDVVIVDNFSRRAIDAELGCDSLTPIASLEDRLNAWNNEGKARIAFESFDIARDYDRLVTILRRFEPDSIVHFAEQRAAPYSMRSQRHKRYTVDNNINATHSVLCAMVEIVPDAHLVHLGTMGVYGYGRTGGLEIPEGYVDARLSSGGQTADLQMLYPTDAGSIYHMTKSLDQLVFQFYAKNDKISITDLHQGIVWGTVTDETGTEGPLVNRFDYDGDYGTVLNRFLMQAAIGHPLTVHGSGGQTRAFIHIRDTIRCIELAILNPPERGERVRILNQMTESHRIKDLADIVTKMTGASVVYLENPRKEKPENDLRVSNNGLLNLGLKPTKLTDGLMQEVIDIAVRHANRCDRSKIIANVKW